MTTDGMATGEPANANRSTSPTSSLPGTRRETTVVSQAWPRIAIGGSPLQAWRQSRIAASNSEAVRNPDTAVALERLRQAASRRSDRSLSASIRSVCSAPIRAKRTSTSLRERPSSLPRRSAILASSSGTRRVVRGPRCFGALVRAVRACLPIPDDDNASN